MPRWLNSLVNVFRGRGTKPTGRRRSLRVRAGYDAAQTTKETEKHWADADSLSANALLDPSTRQLLRDRARQECANNGYAFGLVESLANDTVGTGPRLQLSIPGVSRETCRAIETAWSNWSAEADYAEDLRVLHKTKARDGEGFALLIDNPRLARSGRTPVTLDLALYEAEQVADPFHRGLDPLYVDGIRRDTAGNPIEYTFLKTHPGGVNAWLSVQTEKFPAESVLHWYTATRPGQARGVSTIVPGLNLFAQLRRYTLATLSAAELAAMLAGVLKTTAPMDGSTDSVTIETMDAVELVRGALLTLPADCEATQFRPEQPTGNYKDFKNELLTEIGRASAMPFGVIGGTNKDANFSSGRLDQLLYHRAIRVERSRLRHRVLDRVFLAWVQEAALAGAIPPKLPPVASWSWEWHFDGFDSIDPQKDAQTDEVELRNNTTTLQAVYARKGLDWEEQLRQRARERALMAELGLPADAAPAMPAPVAPEPEGAADA